jgi:alpha-ketoglutarate-dependent taurine dioxygenase
MSSGVENARKPGAAVDGDLVRVHLADGRELDLHRLALRDGCSCVFCRHPVSGQRLYESRDVVPGARVAGATLSEGTLHVTWADGHESSYDGDWLAAATRPRPERTATLWGSELTESIPGESYANVVESRDALRRVLAAVAEYGFARITAAPVEDGGVTEVAELFAHVRTTNYGRYFDVTVRIDATNLADTAMALSLHTDNPYRAPVPTLQLLQCLTSSATGGETVLADGFRAASHLAPEQLAILAGRSIRFAYRDDSAELVADAPVIELDISGAPVALRVNNRSKDVPTEAAPDVAAWYEAYFALLDVLGDPAARVVLRLAPGDVLVFDNLRVLHGRTGFSGEGTRRLQGCYADRDGLLSTLAVLERPSMAELG